MGDGRFWMFVLSGSAAKGGPFGLIIHIKEKG